MRTHKSLIAWQAARAVTRIVLRLSAKDWKPHLRAVFDQLQRSSLSVQINIAEGYGFGDCPRMRNHWRIAYASAIETQDLLELLEGRQSQQLLVGLMRRYGGLSNSVKSESEKCK